MLSHWCLNDCKPSQVSRTLLSIMADLNNAADWMVSIHSLISKSSCPWRSTVCLFFFQFPSKVQVLIFLFTSFQFYSSKVHNSVSSNFFIFLKMLLLLTITRPGRLAEIKWSVCISKSQRSLCVSFSRTDVGLFIYHLVVRSNFGFLHNSLWISFATQLYLVLYTFCANLQHSLIMWLIVSSPSPHNLHLLFCCVLSIFTSV